MTGPASPQSEWWRSALPGFLAGAATVIVLGIVVVAVSLVVSVPLMLILSAGFGAPGPLLLLLALIVLALVSLWGAGWAWNRFAHVHVFGQQRDPAGWIALSIGALLGAAAAAALMPATVKDVTVRLVTGQSIAERAPLPSSEAERQRLTQRVRPEALAGDPAAQVELALALRRGAAGEARDVASAVVWVERAEAHPQGFEARLLQALDRRAKSLVQGGRLVTDEDSALRVAALRRVAADLPSDWQSVVLGTIGGVQQTHDGEQPSEQPMRDTMVEAGRAGSRAFALLAATYDEAAATRDEREGRAERATEGLRRAQQGYAAAGAIFEVERLRIETLADRLADLPDPPPAAAFPPPDAGIAQRFWRFAWALDADDVHERTEPGHRELAAALSLLAMERSPDPASIASLNPARRWAANPWALGRFLLALRHARGDCAAALELSNSIRSRRRTGFSGITPNVSFHDLAWALAWAEVAERCAPEGDLRQEAGERRRSLESMYVDARDLGRARTGVSATIAALR